MMRLLNKLQVFRKRQRERERERPQARTQDYGREEPFSGEDDDTKNS